MRMRVTRTKVAAVREVPFLFTLGLRERDKGNKLREAFPCLVRNFAFSLTATSLYTISLDTFFGFLAHF